jgi:hypothetical protein
MKKQKLDFNAWMDHISNQLQEDYRKLYYSSKFKQDANIQRVSRKESKDLRRIQTLRLFADQ